MNPSRERAGIISASELNAKSAEKFVLTSFLGPTEV